MPEMRAFGLFLESSDCMLGTLGKKSYRRVSTLSTSGKQHRELNTPSSTSVRVSFDERSPLQMKGSTCHYAVAERGGEGEVLAEDWMLWVRVLWGVLRSGFVAKRAPAWVEVSVCKH